MEVVFFGAFMIGVPEVDQHTLNSHGVRAGCFLVRGIEGLMLERIAILVLSAINRALTGSMQDSAVDIVQ